MNSLQQIDPRVFKVYSKSEMETMKPYEVCEIASNKMEYHVTRLFNEDVALLSVWTCVDRRADLNCETFGFDMRNTPGCFHYNPYIICQSPLYFMEYIVVTQALKLLLRHCTYRVFSNKPIHAIASNITINCLLPERMTKSMIVHVDFLLPKTFEYEDKLSLEEYYLALLDNKKAEEQAQKSSSESNEEGEGEGEGNGYVAKPFENSDKAVEKALTGLDNKNWSENAIIDNDVKNCYEKNKSSNKNWGNYTGNILDVIHAAQMGHIDWRNIIKRFGRSVESRKSIPTRMRWNRRTGFIDPGYRREYSSRVLVAPDTSGSVSDEAIAEALGVVKVGCKHSKVDVAFWDTQICLVDKKVDKKNKKKNTFNIAGRGGTDVQCVFDYADKNNYDGVVIITDGYFGKPNPPKKTKTKYVWLMEKGNYNKDIQNIIPIGRAYEMEKGGKRIV